MTNVVFDSRTPSPKLERRTGAADRRERVTPLSVERGVVTELEPLLHYHDDYVKDIAYRVLMEVRKLNR